MDDQENRKSGDEYEPRITDLTALLSLAHEVITNDTIWGPAWQAVLGRSDLFSDSDEDRLRALLHDAADYYSSAVQGYAEIAPIMEFITKIAGPDGTMADGIQIIRRDEQPAAGDGEIQLPADAKNYL